MAWEGLVLGAGGTASLEKAGINVVDGGMTNLYFRIQVPSWSRTPSPFLRCSHLLIASSNRTKIVEANMVTSLTQLMWRSPGQH